MPGAPGVVTESLTVGGVPFSVYWDPRVRTRRPGLLFVHGGGWRAGSRARFTAESVQIARAGLVGVTTDYRFADRVDGRWPGQRNDLVQVWRSLRRNAARYALDPGRMAVVGESAGGHLALTLAAALPAPERPSAVVSWSGPTDLARLVTDPHADCLGDECFYFTTLAPTIVNHLLRCAPGACTDRYADASPVSHIRSLPATMLTTFERDIVPSDQAGRLETALRSVGAAPTVVTFPGFGHGASTADVWARTAAWLGPSLGVDIPVKVSPQGRSPNGQAR